MYISYQELVAMTICAALSAFMLAMLFYSNYKLLNENRLLRSRVRRMRKRCEQEHVSVPF
jgi:hypothetical protein